MNTRLILGLLLIGLVAAQWETSPRALRAARDLASKPTPTSEDAAHAHASRNTYSTPCIYNNNTYPQGCTPRVKIVTCNLQDPSNNYPTITIDENTACSATNKLALQEQVNVQCKRLSGSGNSGNCVSITMKVGEYWGVTSSGTYNCMGQCGASCVSYCSFMGGSWSRRCLRHDVCSFMFLASGGDKDPNCGTLYTEAEAHFVTGSSNGCCLGSDNGNF